MISTKEIKVMIKARKTLKKLWPNLTKLTIFSENLVRELPFIPNLVKFYSELEILLMVMFQLEKWKLKNSKIV